NRCVQLQLCLPQLPGIASRTIGLHQRANLFALLIGQIELLQHRHEPGTEAGAAWPAPAATSGRAHSLALCLRERRQRSETDGKRCGDEKSTCHTKPPDSVLDSRAPAFLPRRCRMDAGGWPDGGEE